MTFNRSPAVITCHDGLTASDFCETQIPQIYWREGLRSSQAHRSLRRYPWFRAHLLLAVCWHNGQRTIFNGHSAQRWHNGQRAIFDGHSDQRCSSVLYGLLAEVLRCAVQAHNHGSAAFRQTIRVCLCKGQKTANANGHRKMESSSRQCVSPHKP